MLFGCFFVVIGLLLFLPDCIMFGEIVFFNAITILGAILTFFGLETMILGYVIENDKKQGDNA